MKINAKQIFDGHAFAGGGTVHLDNARVGRLDLRPQAQGASLVMPGIIDSHVHLLGVGTSLQALRLNNCRCRGDFTMALKTYAANYAGEWITGRGWDQNLMDFMPDRHFLDQICPDRPVILNRACGHVAVANSRALALAGVDANSQGIPGGVIKRDEAGEPTGILEEKATSLVYRVVPSLSPALLYTALEKAIKYAYSCGITGVQTDDLGAVGNYGTLWELYTKVTEANPIRAQLHHRTSSAESLKEFIRAKGELQDTAFIYAGAAKLLLDGSLGARTAALLEDYYDDPGNKGVLIFSDDELRKIFTIAEDNGVQLAMHTIGDAALAQALRLLNEVRGGYSRGQIMHRVIHCQVATKIQLEQMAALGMMAEIQPGFLPTDMRWAEDRLGPERLQSSYCWRSMAEAGLFLTGGSDAPVEDINPWLGIAAAVTRKNGEGTYASSWHRDESLTLAETLALYTLYPAKLAGWQDLGSIKPGMRGDIGIYKHFDGENLAGTQPDQVLVDGTIVYQR